MAIEYELTLHDYLSILKRRWVQMLVVFLLVLLAAIATAVLLPPTYQSTGTILVESQQIPPDLVKATVTSFADERIAVITSLDCSPHTSTSSVQTICTLRTSTLSKQTTSSPTQLRPGC